ncbi:oligosaccharide flippase family protein [Chelatococcus sp. SYSU_G07232]|uniref:Oligosaccharide flippase family protein n=1 Tax=Chelatococcus albus TaxID=3047466 RepID=A0ABT7ALL5_9HYPH|nr:oligosaccharide flippase family protein [Chelatococcus sp. SYSU_G07232]MDJ1160275.1 oligosaccharide flippase family protein [Chelatococcus sp. SYSU_G07232]
MSEISSPAGCASKIERNSLAAGVIWNLGALAFLAAAGILLNLAIGRFYGPEVLGTFNIAFAIFIFLSQVAVFGLQLSALHAASTADTREEELVRIVYGGLVACLGIAIAVSLVSILAIPFIAKLFPRVPDLPTAWLIAAPGLVPFALNKYLLGIVNGLQLMRAFAIVQGARFALMLLALVAMALLGAPGEYLAAILTISETILLLCLGAFVWRIVPFRAVGRMARSAADHVRFGVRVMPAGIVTELNSRVDVLILGALMNDRMAGIYTVAALVYEAALQAVVVIRNNISPGLARDLRDDHLQHILGFSRRLGLAMLALASLGGIVGYALFPWFLRIAFPAPDFLLAQEPLLWLLLALPFAAGPLSYSLILSQAGCPGWQSVAMAIMLAANIALNFLLIAAFGIAGAGMAMGLSAILGGLTIIVLARLILGVRLFF